MTTPTDGDTPIGRKRRAFAVLRAALEVEGDVRAQVIVDACGGDRALAREVHAMLAARPARVLDRDALDLVVQLDLANEQIAPGNLLGGWRIVSALGEGGMGAVYLAERSGDGYVQRGALKLIKRGMDSLDLLARFRRERQILSRLAHPAIARLLDGGLADDGRPFLVMEHINGETLLAWSERTQAGIERRIALFLELCEAVAHAHHQLIVHRDIKPANVMVDVSGRPKLLDFGIAKVLEDTAAAERTATAARLLSRAYAAPEQDSDGTITTATDIYQLGVLLFELLSGARYSDLGNLRAARPAQRLALAREHAKAAGPAAISAGELHGDPGILLARATAPDPARRYATVEAFADDIRRWRAGHPISARADSGIYRLRCFLARNRLGVAAAAVVALTIIAGAGVALWQAQRAGAEARMAREQALTAERVKRFMVTLFSASDPAVARGEMPRADQLLAIGATRIATELADEPRIQAELYEAMGSSYVGLGRFDAGADLYARGITALANLRDAAPLRARLQRMQAGVQAELGQYARALASLDSADQTRLHNRDVDPRERERGAMIRGWVLRDLGRLDESEAVLTDALARLTPDPHVLTPIAAAMLNNLAYTLQVAGKREPSLAAFERLSGWAAATLDQNDPQRLWASWSHARALREFGQAPRARDLLERIRPAMLRVAGADHADAAGLDIVLGQAEMDLGELSAGHARIVDAVARSHRTTHHNALWAQAEFALAEADWRIGDLSAARAHFRAARATWSALLGEDHAAIRDCDSYLAAIDARSLPASDAVARLAALVDLRRARAEPGLALTLKLQSAAVAAPAGAH